MARSSTILTATPLRAEIPSTLRGICAFDGLERNDLNSPAYSPPALPRMQGRIRN